MSAISLVANGQLMITCLVWSPLDGCGLYVHHAALAASITKVRVSSSVYVTKVSRGPNVTLLNSSLPRLIRGAAVDPDIALLVHVRVLGR